MKPEVSRTGVFAIPAVVTAVGEFPLHAAADPSSPTLAATKTKDRLMLISRLLLRLGSTAICILRACNGLRAERMGGRRAGR